VSQDRLPPNNRKMPTAKFYAVATGRKTGIYRSWSDCEKQVRFDGLMIAIALHGRHYSYFATVVCRLIVYRLLTTSLSILHVS